MSSLEKPSTCESCPYQLYIDGRVNAVERGIAEMDGRAISAETPESFLEMEVSKKELESTRNNLEIQRCKAFQTCNKPRIYRWFGLIGKKIIECSSPTVWDRDKKEWQARYKVE